MNYLKEMMKYFQINGMDNTMHIKGFSKNIEIKLVTKNIVIVYL